MQFQLKHLFGMVLSFGIAFGINHQLKFPGILIVVGLFWTGMGLVLAGDMIDQRRLKDRVIPSVLLHAIGKMLIAMSGIVGLMWILLAVLLFVLHCFGGFFEWDFI